MRPAQSTAPAEDAQLGQGDDAARLARITLAHLFQAGRRDLGDLVAACGPVEALQRLRAGDVPGRLAQAGQGRVDEPDVRAALSHVRRLGVRVITPEDDEWPTQLADLVTLSRADSTDRHPPLCLWVRGTPNLRRAIARSVAIVGARAASEYGGHVASELGYGLADRGWAVVSGGAYGIDAAAHRGALAAGGTTVAVFACGIDHAYPVGHASLFERIVDSGGLLVSEWPIGVTPARHRFLVRNRVIAALTRGTVVVEAAARSGSRATLHRARDMGRAAMAVPGPVTSAMSVGSHSEIRDGRTSLVTSTAEVLEEVGRIGEDLAPLPRGVEQPRDKLTPEAVRLLDAIPAQRPAGAESIAIAAGLGISEVNRLLPLLLLAGMIEEAEQGYRLTAAHRAPSSGRRHPRPRLR